MEGTEIERNQDAHCTPFTPNGYLQNENKELKLMISSGLSTTLPQPTIEVRICTDERPSREDTLVQCLVDICHIDATKSQTLA